MEELAGDRTSEVTGARIMELEAQLAEAREELRIFAYGASHDLREPVRMMLSYIELLSRRYGTQLDEPGREYIGFALEGARRMNRLMDDLLTYSRVSGSEPLKLAEVNLAGSIHWAMMNLEQPIKESGAQVEWESMPTVRADENRIVLVVQQLLDNAIKFRRPELAPRIRITAEAGDGVHVLCFADNGLGFEQRFAERTFEVFKRLHGKEIPGNGMGLAIARKVIERHHGRIWAESEAGQGSRFCFSLPV